MDSRTPVSLADLMPEFSVASDIQSALSFLETDPTKAVHELRQTAEGLRDRKDEMPRDEYKADLDRIGGALDLVREDAEQIADAPTLYEFAMAAQRVGRLGLASEFWDKARQADSDDVEMARKIAYGFLSAYRHNSNGAYIKKAIKASTAAVNIDHSARSYAALGDAYFAYKNHKKAVQNYITAAKQPDANQTQPDGYLYRRISYITRRFLSDDDGAVEWAEKAYGMDRSEGRNIEELGCAYSAVGRHHEAIPLLMYANALKPHIKTTLNKLLQSLRDTDQLELALEYTEKMKDAGFRPGDIASRQFELKALIGQIRNSDLASLEQFAKEAPHDPDIAARLGRELHAQARFEDALPHLLTVLQYDERGGMNMLSRTLDCLRELGRADEATKLLADSLRHYGDRPETLLAAGYHAFKLGDEVTARQFALRLQDGHPDFRATRGLLIKTEHVGDDVGTVPGADLSQG